jgi:hypothetical protein
LARLRVSRRSNVDHFAGVDFLYCCEEFLLDQAIVGQLVLGNMGHDDPKLELREVVLKLNALVDGGKRRIPSAPPLAKAHPPTRPSPARERLRLGARQGAV